jgi:sugar phosphate isomerase/epimerase
LMKTRIRSTHLHDNDGKSDIHLFPFFAEGGSIDWKQTMELLRKQPGQYPLVLELRETPEFPVPQSLETVRQIFDKLETI